MLAQHRRGSRWVVLCLLVAVSGCSDAGGADPVNPAADAGAFPTAGGTGPTDTSVVDTSVVEQPVDCLTDGDCSGTLSHPCLTPACNQVVEQCFQAPVLDGTPCESGNACMKTQICMAGQCTGGQEISCDDQDPCTDDSCDPSLGCVHVTNINCCEPQCLGKECGSDGCGGACGICLETESCVNSLCMAGGCTPGCAGKVCGDDGCGGVCGACNATETCINGQCVGPGPCTPQCGIKECGNNGCGGSCGTCPMGVSCSGQGQCVGCSPSCFGKECGDDGCGDVCGTCPIGVPCDTWGTCDFCSPQCGGKECGDDGCGGVCGTCGGQETCDTGVCINLSKGSTCEDPFVVGALPFVAQSDTTGFSNNYAFTDGVCPGETWGQGTASPDHVYSFTAPSSGNYLFKLEVVGFYWGALYVVSSCGDVSGSCAAAGKTSSQWNPVELIHYLKAGEQIFAIVDGYDDGWITEEGSYTLVVEGNAGCPQNCVGLDCGEDGCGGLCGVCGGAQLCGPMSQCVDPGEGSTCAQPYDIDSLPYWIANTTEGATNDYLFDDDVCPGESTGQGSESPDQVYTFTAPSSGNYLFRLEVESLYWGAIYVVSNCGDVSGSCGAAGKTSSQWTPVGLIHYLKAGEQVFVIVDGYDNNNSGWIGEAGGYTLTVEENIGCPENCVGLKCGDNGCGGLCGVCDDGQVCSVMSQCVDPGAGSTCAQAFAIDSLPYWTQDTTAGATNDYYFSDGFCAQDSWESGQGIGSPDHVYEFTAPSSGNYLFNLEVESPFWGSMYVVTDCGDVDGTCGEAGTTSSQWTPIELIRYLEAWEQVFVIVDGYDNNSWTEAGSYTLTVEADAGCPENCLGLDCGDDGCGGLCGVCGGGQVCGPMSQCVDPGEGSTCSQAYEIDSLPYWIENTTEGATNDYYFSDGFCAQDSWESGQGIGSPDHAYAFTPTSSGNYLFMLEVESLYWGSMYVVTDCGDVDGTCGEAGTTSSQWTPIELIRYLEAWEQVFVIVDGYDNNNDWDTEEGGYTLTVDEAL